jgi:hypothetical protein
MPTDQDLRPLPEITTEKTLSSHLIIQPSFENSIPVPVSLDTVYSYQLKSGTTASSTNFHLSMVDANLSSSYET